jgi:hypothetical protein
MGSTGHLTSWADGAGVYSHPMFKFMVERPWLKPRTESYVTCPPALHIRDDEGATWTLGFDYNHTEWLSGKYEYDVLRNGRKTGEFCRIIEFRGGKLRIFGAEGWKTWAGRMFI